jgi:hypothetical protein
VKVNVIIIFTSTLRSDQQKRTCAVTEATDARKATTADVNFMVDLLLLLKTIDRKTELS